MLRRWITIFRANIACLLDFINAYHSEMRRAFSSAAFVGTSVAAFSPSRRTCAANASWDRGRLKLGPWILLSHPETGGYSCGSVFEPQEPI